MANIFDDFKPTSDQQSGQRSQLQASPSSQPPPQDGGNIFSGYKPAAQPSATSTSTSTSTSVPAAPSGDFSTTGSSVSDFLSGLIETPKFNPPKSVGEALVRAQEGASKIGATARVAANALGIYDPVAAAAETAAGSGSFSENLAAEQAKTEQARKQAGGYAAAGEVLGNIVPVSKLNLAARTAEALGGGRLAGIVGSALESGAANVGSAYGHGEDPWTAGVLGVLGGGALGAFGSVGRTGGRGPYELGKDYLTAEQYKNAAQAKYGETGQIQFSYPQIAAISKNASADIANQAPRVMAEGQGALKTLTEMHGEALQNGGMSAERLNDYLGKLHSSETGDAVPVAGQIAQGHINNTLATEPPISGHAPGAAATTLADAKTLHGQAQDMGQVESMESKAAVPGGSDLASQTSSWLRGETGQRFVGPDTSTYAAASTLASTPAKAGYIPWWAKHFIVYPAVSALGQEALGEMSGDQRSPWNRLASGAIEGALVGAGTAGHKAITGGFKSAAQQRALDALKATIGSGQLQQPVLPNAPVRELLRQLYTSGLPTSALSP